MKVKLLRKIRSRIVSVEFCNKRYAIIGYYDRNYEFSCHSVSGKGQILLLIRYMFGGHFANDVEQKNNQASLKRLEKTLNSPIKYRWEENK